MFIVVCWEGFAVVFFPWWDERVCLDSGLYLKLALTADDLGGGFKRVSSQTWGKLSFLTSIFIQMRGFGHQLVVNRIRKQIPTP